MKAKQYFNSVIFIIVLLSNGHKLFGASSDTPSLLLSSENVKGDVKLTAVLKDSKGKPIPDAPIYLSIETSFGPLKLKSIPTEQDGSASLLISGMDRRGDFTVEAVFKGDNAHSQASANANISFNKYEVKESSSFRLPLPFFVSFAQVIDYLFPKQTEIVLSTEDNKESFLTGIPEGTGITPYPSVELVSILFVIFAAIWSIYFYVFKQILQLRK